MAQGQLKKSKAPANKSVKNLSKPKKGARVIAPKQRTLVKQKGISKKLSASINNNIERQMAVKAGAVGKLTIMKKLADEAAATSKDKKGNPMKGGKKGN
ncbi:hypothetical protein BC943DRAFT_313622 [Umbelopsis sp. AD052]|nr:hypothetical protein BC943DRAFT_313622 [Umbelopsis sp. AD052]